MKYTIEETHGGAWLMKKGIYHRLATITEIEFWQKIKDLEAGIEEVLDSGIFFSSALELNHDVDGLELEAKLKRLLERGEEEE